ncbi:succinate dehydrogenase cytochrome b subunit [Bacteriovoracales bacterium]|nr:succinate dehydrogenase cytochrome b subunit [Bacteriovoracales bacterium]
MFSKLFNHLNSSIIKKQTMGVAGLLLCGFITMHFLGNLLIFVGPEAFNLYAHTLTSNPLIYAAEAGLLAIFLVHIGVGVKLTIENNNARPQKYYMKQPTGRGANFSSSTMPYTGIIILIFVILHILGLKFGTYYETSYDGVKMRDLYKLVIEYFRQPSAVLGYVVAMLSLGIHLRHGFWSAFQSLGFNHPKYNNLLILISKAFAFIMAIGFSSLPIFCFYKGGN